MSLGPSAVESEAQGYRKDFGAALPGYLNTGTSWMNDGRSQLGAANTGIQNFISGIGQDKGSMDMQSYLSRIMSGDLKAAQGSAQFGSASNVPMQGSSFAQQFGSDLGGLALQQKNMGTVADKLSSTTNNPFATLTRGAMEDAAFQNSQGMSQLQSQLAAQGLDSSSGAGAAALQALQFSTNKSVADAGRQNAVQGAQFQQQGLGMAGNLYQQMGALDLQRASTGAQLGLSGYQADVGNAQRLDAMSMQNAQLGTQANMANASAQNQWQMGGLQGQLGLLQNQQAQQLQAYGLLSQNAGQVMNAGQNLWGQAFQGQQGYMNNLNQAAQQSAAGRGQMWGSILQGGLGLAGTLLGGPVGGALAGGLGRMFTGGGQQTTGMGQWPAQR